MYKLRKTRKGFRAETRRHERVEAGFRRADLCGTVCDAKPRRSERSRSLCAAASPRHKTAPLRKIVSFRAALLKSVALPRLGKWAMDSTTTVFRPRNEHRESPFIFDAGAARFRNPLHNEVELSEPGELVDDDVPELQILWQVARQLLTENALLALAGGVALLLAGRRTSWARCSAD